MTDSNHGGPTIAPNLIERNFVATEPDHVWLGDITYVRTAYVRTDESWLDLAAIKDAATREIVGWAMDDHLEASLCCRALIMAIQRRNPAPGLIFHSDRGSQYVSGPYRKILHRHKISASMSRKGDCWDNASPSAAPAAASCRDRRNGLLAISRELLRIHEKREGPSNPILHPIMTHAALSFAGSRPPTTANAAIRASAT